MCLIKNTFDLVVPAPDFLFILLDSGQCSQLITYSKVVLGRTHQNKIVLNEEHCVETESINKNI